MDFLNPAMVALYVILGAFVIAFLYITLYGSRLHILSRQITPDSFKQKESEEAKNVEAKAEATSQPLYPQRVQISGYTIEPQPHNVDVSNELVRTTVRKVCSIDDDCCSH